MKGKYKEWELTELCKLEDIKRELQRIQIDKCLDDNFDALLLLLIRKGAL